MNCDSKRDRNHMGSLKAKTVFGAVSHAGERIVKANRSIQKSVRFPMKANRSMRAQE